MNAKREARRKRDQEDFLRVTTQSIKDHGIKLPAGTVIGNTHGPTYREHLEDRLAKAVESYRNDRTEVRRGIVRGLAIALALYENSYDASIERIKKIEKEFM